MPGPCGAARDPHTTGVGQETLACTLVPSGLCSSKLGSINWAVPSTGAWGHLCYVERSSHAGHSGWDGRRGRTHNSSFVYGGWLLHQEQWHRSQQERLGVLQRGPRLALPHRVPPCTPCWEGEQGSSPCAHLARSDANHPCAYLTQPHISVLTSLALSVHSLLCACTDTTALLYRNPGRA